MSCLWKSRISIISFNLLRLYPNADTSIAHFILYQATLLMTKSINKESCEEDLIYPCQLVFTLHSPFFDDCIQTQVLDLERLQPSQICWAVKPRKGKENFSFFMKGRGKSIVGSFFL